MAKKFLSALLAVLMVISIVPMTAMATGVAETTPTLVVGLSNSQTTANTDIGKVLAGTASIGDAEGATNILWFAMTGLGSDKKYKLSMKNSKGVELLGTKYADYNTSPYDTFVGAARKFIYVSLANGVSGGKNQQIDSDALIEGSYTVQLLNASTLATLATRKVTLTKKDNTWSCTQDDEDNLGEIKFREPEEDVFGSAYGNMELGKFQEGIPTIKVTADGTDNWKVSVGGAKVKYVPEWTTGWAGVQQHGYYVAISVPKVLCGHVVSKWTVPCINAAGAADTKEIPQANFTEYDGSYCDIITYLGETAEEAKKKTTKWEITYGNLPKQTYTLDFAGLEFPDETLKAETATDDVYGKSVAEIQNDIEAKADPATKTIIVTGTSYYLSEAWASAYGSGDDAKGNFVALKLSNKAGVTMQRHTPALAGKPDEWKALSSDGVLVFRMQNIEKAGYKAKFKVGANAKGGTEWTIDYSGVEMRPATSTRLEVDALNGSLGASFGNVKGSDLQSDITSTRTTANGVTTITFRGESNYYYGMTGFGAQNEGNYIALKLTKPTGWNIQFTSPAGAALDNASTGQYTVILDGSNNYKNELKLTKTGEADQKFILDFSKIKRLPAKIDSVIPSPSPITAEGMTKMNIAYDSTNDKIVLSGLVESMKDNKNLFSTVGMTVKYAKDGAGTKNIDVRFTKVGDILEAAAIPATVAGNTLSFDTSKLLIKSENATDSVTTKAPEAAVSTSIPEEQKKAAEEVAKTLTDNSGKVSVDKDTLQKYANVISNESEAKKELVSDAATIVSANADKVPTKLKNRIDEGDVNTVVLAYAKIEVVGAETNDKNEITNFQLDITPMARTIVTTVANTSNIKLFDSTKDATANVNANAIEVKNEEIAISESTDVTLALPASYKADKAYIIHTKDDGKVYNYTGKIEGSNPRTLSFTSEHGFSSFTITSTEPAKSKDATLKSVKVSGTEAVLSGTAYTATLPKDTDLTKLTLTVTPNSDMAKITVNGTAYTAGTSVDIDLSANKTVTIAVTAEDGTTKATYALTAKLAEDMPSELYKDLPTDAGMRGWVEKAINYGIMGDTGTAADGKLLFSPNDRVERKYLVLMVARADVMAKDATITNKAAADAKLKSLYSGTPAFSDAPANDETVNAALEYCKINGIISGYEDGTFKPNNYISRTEAASILVGWLDLPDAGEENTNNFKDWAEIGWAHGKVNSVVKAGLMNGMGNGIFGTGTLIRQQTAVILTGAFENLRDSK